MSISENQERINELILQQISKEQQTVPFKAKISYISNKGLLTLGFNQPIDATLFNLTKLSSKDLEFSIEPSYEATQEERDQL
jgi:hypothetical protein